MPSTSEEPFGIVRRSAQTCKLNAVNSQAYLTNTLTACVNGHKQSRIAKKASLGLKFSEDGYAELKKLFHLTIDNLRIAQTIFVISDTRPPTSMTARPVLMRFPMIRVKCLPTVPIAAIISATRCAPRVERHATSPPVCGDAAKLNTGSP